MHLRSGMFLLSALVGASALLAESTAIAQVQPSSGSAPSQPEAAAPSPPAPGYQPPAPGYPPPAPAYGYPPAPGYGYPPPVYGYPPPIYGYPPPPPVIEPPEVPASQRPGYHTHDGFFLRLHAGMGYLASWETQQGIKRTTSGGGFSFSAAFGGTVASNLVLYGEILGTVVPDPSRSNSENSLYPYSTSGLTAGMVGVGPGIAYFLEPINMYFSGTATYAQYTLDASCDYDNGTYYYNCNSGSSSTVDKANGFGLSAVAGKEWWVSTNWGLGLALQFQWATLKDKYADAWRNALGFALLFSSTYN